MKKLCCDVMNQSCMYRSCVECSNRNVLEKEIEEETLKSRTFYYEFKLCDHEYYNKNSVKVMTKITVKQKTYCTVKELIERLQETICTAFPHEYSAVHQIKAAKDTKQMKFPCLLIFQRTIY